MIVDASVWNELSGKAKASQRLWQCMDLKNGTEENSQRKLNVIKPKSVLPIHRD